MKRMIPSMVVGLAFATLFVLTSCSSDDEPTTPEPISSAGGEFAADTPSVDDVGGMALVAIVKGDPVKYRVLSTGDDEAITNLGGLVCSGFDDGLPFLTVVDAVTEIGADMMESAAFVGAAVGGMCPEHRDKVGEY